MNSAIHTLGKTAAVKLNIRRRIRRSVSADAKNYPALANSPGTAPHLWTVVQDGCALFRGCAEIR